MSSIRVIAGRFGGRLLDAPKENSTRTKPMGERIRNAMFNSIGNEINGAQVLDAFAGTGAVGLEALSRGAAHVTFIERDKIAQKILSKNPQFSTVSKLFGLLKPGGLMVLSHPGRGEEPNLGNEIVVVDNRSYGNAYLTSFRRESCDS